MKFTSIFTRRTLTTLTSFLIIFPVYAQYTSDIDIYSGSSSSGDRTNVLLILDSSANWSAGIPGATNCYYKDNGVVTALGPTADQGTKLGIEKCALYNVIDGLPVAKSGGPDNDALFNIAIMLMNKANNNGGYPRKAFLPLTTTNKAVFKTLIKGLVNNDEKGSNADYGQALYEAYLYYKGMTPLNGTSGTQGTGAAQWDANAVTAGKYNSPSKDSCAGNYIIVIGNGSPQNSDPERRVKDLLAERVDADFPTMSVTDRNALKARIVNAKLGNDEANWSDEMARFMRGIDVSGKQDSQGIITHAVAVIKGSSDGDFPFLMNSIANFGGGNYYEAKSADVLVESLVKIFNSMQAVNSVFASASLPVSVNARGTYDNQIFLGTFRPDADAKPRWRGNLKQYKFELDNLDNLYLADSNGNSALNSSTGFIDPAAVSYWTTDSDFWKNQTLGTPPTKSDSPDGEVVEKGAAAQRLREVYAESRERRNVFTCVDCAKDSVLGAELTTKFITDNSAISQALTGTTTSTDRANLIEWVRGTDNISGDEKGPGGGVSIRPSVHGDILHSRPAVLNFGGEIGIVVFYGGNDGMLHAVSGKQSGEDAGNELWSFVPQEMFGKLNRLRLNSPEVRISTTVSTTATPRDYFVDGPIGVYQKIVGGVTTKAILYVTMRRGGRLLYAIDVTTPTAPKFLWKKTSTDLSKLGQTWSEPKVARIKGYPGGTSPPTPVIIMGGGYDAAAEDANSPGTTTMGNAVYVLDALTGTVLKAFEQHGGTDDTLTTIGRSIAADVKLVDSNNDGLVDRAYAVDLGGQVYRIDFETADGNAKTNWTMYKVADLSAGTLTGRKFFYPPDAIVTSTFTALMLGSGDREKPLLSATEDHFFQIFDRNVAIGAPKNANPIVWSRLAPASATPNIPTDGCYVSLDQGEKVVNAAASSGGDTYFGTNRPGSTSSGNICSANLGIAKSYAMPLFCVAPTGTILKGGGLPPSPVTGIVNIQISTLNADGTTTTSIRQKSFVIGAPNTNKSSIGVGEPPKPTGMPRSRRYWFQESTR